MWFTDLYVRRAQLFLHHLLEDGQRRLARVLQGEGLRAETDIMCYHSTLDFWSYDSLAHTPTNAADR